MMLTSRLLCFQELGSNPIKHSWERDGLTHVLDTTHPGGASFDTHAESRVGDTAVAPQVEVPLKSFLGETVESNLFLQELQRGCAFTAADNLPITFRSKHIDS